ncbi:MAG: hypothetical protein WC011_00050 [Candidatus Paceibacterota bacterium]
MSIMSVLNFVLQIKSTDGLLKVEEVSKGEAAPTLLISATIVDGFLYSEDDLIIQDKNFRIQKIKVAGIDRANAMMGEKVTLEINNEKGFQEELKNILQKRKEEIDDFIADFRASSL